MSGRRISSRLLSGLASVALLAGTLAVAEFVSKPRPVVAAAAVTAAPVPVDPGVPSATGAPSLSSLEVTSEKSAATRSKANGTEYDPPVNAEALLNQQRAAAPKPKVVGFDKSLSVEDNSKRASRSSTFKNVDGTETMQLFSGPKFFKAKSGSWDPIDTATIDEAGAGFKSAANEWTAHFKPLPAGVQLDLADGTSVTISPNAGAKGVKPERQTDGTIIYRDVFAGVDLRYTVTVTGVKEDILLKTVSATSLMAFDFAGVDLVPSKETGGGLVDAGRQESSFTLTPAIVIDAQNVQHPKDSGVAMARVPAPGDASHRSSRVQVSVDSAWLKGLPAAAFPVVIDPSAFMTRIEQSAYGSQAGWACGSNPNCPYAWTGNSQAAGDLYWHSTTTFEYGAALPNVNAANPYESKVISAAFYANYAGGTTANGAVVLRWAQAYSYCGTNVGGNCANPPLPLIGGGQQFSTTNNLAWDITSTLQQAWTTGAPMQAYALSGDENPGFYSFKQWTTSMSITYARTAIPSATSSPAHLTVKHWPGQGLTLSTGTVVDPAGLPVYYRFTICTANSWTSTRYTTWRPGCNVKSQSAWQLSNTWEAHNSGAGIPGYYYEGLLPAWGVEVANTQTPGPNDLVMASSWQNNLEFRNLAPPTPTTLSPADGFTWSPNTTVVLSANTVSDPDTSAAYPADSFASPAGDSVDYRFVLREAGAVGAVYQSAWIATTPGTTSFTVPANAPLQAGWRYQWQVETRDIIWSNYLGYISQGNAQGAPSTVRTAKFEQRLGASGPSPFQTLGPVSVNLATGNVATSNASAALTTLGGSLGATMAYNSRAQDTGLRGRYYDDSNFNQIPDGSEFRFERIDPTLSFDWGGGSPGRGLPNDYFVVQWTGFITVPTAGSYKFRAGLDDKVTVQVGATTAYVGVCCTPVDSAIRGDFEAAYAGAIPTNAAVTLAANTPTPITVTYAEVTGAAYMKLLISDATSTNFGAIPTDWLRPSNPVLPAGWTLSTDTGSGAMYTKAEIRSNELVLTVVDGSKLTYVKDPSNPTGWRAPFTEADHVMVNTDGTVQVTSQAGTTYNFRKDGQLNDVTTADSTGSPTSPTHGFTTIPGTTADRLTSLTDPVSGKQVTFTYTGDIGGICPAPGGFAAWATVPVGLLCKITRVPDNSSTIVYYNVAGGQPYLARIENPGGELTDYEWTNGQLTSVRTPNIMDAIVAGAITPGAAPNDFKWKLAYDTSNRLTTVTAPKANPTDSTQPGFEAKYDANGLNTRVFVEGIRNAANAADWNRKVTYNNIAQWTLDQTAYATIATGEPGSGQINERAAWWDDKDQLLWSTANGRYTVNGYDSHGWKTDTWGPAAATCYTTTNQFAVTATAPLPLSNAAGCLANTVPHTLTTFDTDAGNNPLTGFTASWWKNTTRAGAPNALGATPQGASFAWDGAAAPAQVSPLTDNWSARLTGEINAATAGNYGFTLTVGASDSVSLWIDDTNLVNVLPSGTTGTAAIALTAGWHRVRLDYTAGLGTNGLTATWDLNGAAYTAIPAASIRPRLGLKTRVTVDDTGGASPSEVTHTRYDEGWDPAYGLDTSVTVDPAGSALKTSTTYDPTYRVRKTRTLPAGNVTTTAYYGPTETSPAITCPTGTIAAGVNQAGLVKSVTSPAPAVGTAILKQVVYDVLGRAVASRIGTDPWTCTTLDSRGRSTTVAYPLIGTAAARTVTNNYAVVNDPRVVSTIDSAGTITSTSDLLGRTSRYKDVWGRESVTTYDQAGRVVSAGTAPADMVAYPSYDRAGRALTQNLTGTTVATSTYTAGATGGELDTVAYGNNTSLQPITRDNFGRSTSITFKGPGSTSISNSGFETDVWVGSTSTTTSEKHSGSNSLSVASGSSARANVSFTPGVVNTLSGWMKGTGTVTPTIQFFGPTFTLLGTAAAPNTVLSATTWTQWTTAYTPPAGTAFVQVNLVGNASIMADSFTDVNGAPPNPTRWTVSTTPTVLYADSLAWENYSFLATLNLAAVAPAPVHSGTNSIAVTYSAAGGGASFRTASPIAPVPGQGISFWAYGGTGGTTFRINVNPTDTAPSPASKTVTIPPGVWTQVNATWAELGNPATVAKINLVGATAAIQPTYWIDDLQIGTAPTTLYADTLAWENYSFLATLNLAAVAPAPVHSGTNSIAVTYTAAGGGASFRTASPITANVGGGVSFWAYGGTGGTTFRINVNPTDTLPSPASKTVTIPAGVWTQVNATWAELGNPATVAKINLVGATALVQPTYWIDDLIVVGPIGPSPVINTNKLAIAGPNALANLDLTSRTAPSADNDVVLTYEATDTTAANRSDVIIAARKTAGGEYRVTLPSIGGTATVEKKVAGVLTTISTFAIPGTGARTVRFQVQGTNIRTRVWLAATPEPTAWSNETSDTAVTGAGAVGFSVNRIAGVNSVTIDDWSQSDLASSWYFDDVSVMTGATTLSTSGFEIDTWIGSTSTTTSQAHAGLNSLLAIGSATGSQIRSNISFTAAIANTLSGWMKGTGTVTPTIQFFGPTFALLGTATASNLTLSSTAWQQWTTTYTPPTGTSFVQVNLANTDVNSWYLDDVAVTTGGGTTTNLTTDTITMSRSGRVLTDVNDANTSTYGYDTAGRLASAGVPGHAYTYEYSGTAGCGANVAAGKNTNRTAWKDGASTLAAYCYDSADRLTSTTQPGYTAAPIYDAHGNTITLAGQTLSYDQADRHLSTAKGTTTVTYKRDALDRIVERVSVVAGVSKTVRYAYAGTSDAASATLNATNAVTELTLSLPGGVLLTTRTSGQVWSYPNLRFDTVATANETGGKTAGPMFSDPYGNALGALPDNSDGNLDNAYLGQYQRPTEHETGIETLIEMGARGYSPTLGRFLEVDPAESGATFSDYAYVADPVNFSDLNGKWCLPVIGHFLDKRPGHPKECPGAKGATTFYNDVSATVAGVTTSLALATGTAPICAAASLDNATADCVAASVAAGYAVGKIAPIVQKRVGKTVWTAARWVVRAAQNWCPYADSSYCGPPKSAYLDSGKIPIRGVY
jgi:large repetitive protein